MMDMLRVREGNCPPHPGQGRDEEEKGVNGKAGVQGQLPEEEEQGRAQDQRENHEGTCRIQAVGHRHQTTQACGVLVP